MVGNIGPGFAGIAAAQAHVHVTKMTLSHPAVLMILWPGGNGSFLLCCQGPRSSRCFSFGFVNVWPQSRWSTIQKSNEASRQSATSMCDICMCPFQIADSSGSWLIHLALSNEGQKDDRVKVDQIETLELQNVQFAYPARPEIQVLQGISLTINKVQFHQQSTLW